MKAELVKYKLRKSTRLGKRDDLLQMVQISHQGINSHYSYVTFSEDFVTFVGTKLAQGVSSSTPAFLSVDQDAAGVWHVYASYWSSPARSRVLLWSTPTVPGWLNFIKVKRKKSGNTSSQA